MCAWVRTFLEEPWTRGSLFFSAVAWDRRTNFESMSEKVLNLRGALGFLDDLDSLAFTDLNLVLRMLGARAKSSKFESFGVEQLFWILGSNKKHGTCGSGWRLLLCEAGCVEVALVLRGNFFRLCVVTLCADILWKKGSILNVAVKLRQEWKSVPEHPMCCIHCNRVNAKTKISDF